MSLLASHRFSGLSVGLVLAAGAVSAEPVHRVHHPHHQTAVAAAARPLTITRHGGVYRQGDDIVAPGGFSANGYGYPPVTPEERRQARNARIRDNATGLYGAGVDGIGGWGFDDDPETGYNNPAYGNAFNSYVGYNGVPTSLAFGPGFANRYATDHDPDEDDDDVPPGPGELGYRPAR